MIKNVKIIILFILFNFNLLRLSAYYWLTPPGKIFLNRDVFMQQEKPGQVEIFNKEYTESETKRDVIIGFDLIPIIKKHLKDNINARNKHALDLGCGRGAGGSLDLAQEGYYITAIDISDIALNDYQQRLDTAQLDNIELKKSGIVEFLNKAEENSYDIIYANLTLHYFDDNTTRFIFQKIFDVLKPGGVFSLKVVSCDDVRFKEHENMKDLDDNGFVVFIDGPKKDKFQRFFKEKYLKELLNKFSIKFFKREETRKGRKPFMAVVVKPTINLNSIAPSPDMLRSN